MPPSLPEWLSAQWPAALAFLLTFLLVANRLAEESQKFAKLFGPVGRWAYRRAQNRTQGESVDPKVIAKAIELARREWDSRESEAIAAMNRRLSAVSRTTGEFDEENDTLRHDLQVLTAYTVYEARWHQVVNISSAGLIDLPTHLDFIEFEQKYTEDPNGSWRTEIIRAQAIAIREQGPLKGDI